jgi:hypothetical protein
MLKIEALLGRRENEKRKNKTWKTNACKNKIPFIFNRAANFFSLHIQ